MKYIVSFLLLLIPTVLVAQLSVVSISPAPNSVNVPLTTTVSVTFNLPVDSTTMEFSSSTITNIDSVVSYTISPDLKTYSAVAVLKPNKVYFIAMYFGVRSTTGQKFAVPYSAFFTTASSFPPYTISGTVKSGIQNTTVENSIVGLTTASVMKTNNPVFVSWSNVGTDGSFQVPYIANGTYWPFAVKDVDGDGNINPENGIDALAVGDSIIVNGASVSGITLTLKQMRPTLLSEVLSIGDSMARQLPTDRVLKAIRAYNVDTVGRSSSWKFYNAHSSNKAAAEVAVELSGSSVKPVSDPYLLSAMLMTSPLINPATAAASSVVMANTETGGGKTFRTQTVPRNYTLQIEMNLGDLTQSMFGGMFPTPGVQYWGVAYRYGVQSPNNFTAYLEKKFLCNFSTGAVVKTTGISPSKNLVPVTSRLYQNFPNPFNPSTVISYDLAAASPVTLTVYDVLGREVAVLVHGYEGAGKHTVRFDAFYYTSGLYYCVLELPAYREVRAMYFLK